MSRLETISVAALGLALLAAHVLFWAMTMMQTLHASGAMIAAFA
jgi:hypothetical protein